MDEMEVFVLAMRAGDLLNRLTEMQAPATQTQARVFAADLAAMQREAHALTIKIASATEVPDFQAVMLNLA